MAEKMPWDDLPAADLKAIGLEKGGAAEKMPWDDLPRADFTIGERVAPEAPSVARSVLNGVTDALSDAWRYVQGNDRREFDYEELPDELRSTYVEKPGMGQLGPQMALAGTDKGKLDIIRKFFPDIPATTDKFGNVVVSYNGSPYYVNRPGPSMQDARDIGSSMLFGVPLGVAGAGVGKSMLGNIGRIGGAGAGNYAGSVAQDVAAQGVGSTEPIDTHKAILAAGMGGAGEVAAPLFQGMFRKIINSPDVFDAASGSFTPKGRKLISDVGLNPDEVSRSMASLFNDMVKEGIDPRHAAAFAEARTMPGGAVRLSKGDVTRDVSQQGFEDAALKGAYGEGPKNEMRAFREGQQEDLGRSVDAIAEIVGTATGDGTRNVNRLGVDAMGEGAAAAADRLKSLYAQTRNATNAAYTKARDLVAMVPKEHVTDFVQNARKGLTREGFDTATMPDVNRALQRLEAFDGAALENVTGAKINALENWRKSLVNAIDGNTDSFGKMSPQGVALQRIKSQYDEMIGNVLEAGLIQGDKTAVELWKRAKAMRGQQGKFESNDIVRTIIRNDLTPEQTVNTLFGAQNVGFKPEAVQALRTIKELMGDSSPEWAALREEAFKRLLQNQTTGARGRDLNVLFSGDKFATAFNQAMAKNRTLMTELFDADQLKILNQLSRVSLNATNRVPGATNPSGTALVLSRMLQNVFGDGGGRLLNAVVGKGVKVLKDADDLARTQAATSFRPAGPPYVPGQGAVIGGPGGLMLNQQQP